MTRIKICGITTLEDALLCADAGADALGFIFVEGTPRFVTAREVAPIVRALPPFVTPVGVFWNHPSGHVKALAEACGLRALQFHGDETPDDCAAFDLPVIKTVKLTPRTDVSAAADRHAANARIAPYAGCAAVLLDSAARWSEGEAREPIEWAIACEWTSRARIILSGGLSPDNVASAIAVARPYAVDVNSGVEARPGRKDADRVRRFVAEARRAR